MTKIISGIGWYWLVLVGISLLSLLLFINCNPGKITNEEELIELFDPTFNLNLAKLDKFGFEMVENVDAFMVEKTINDTLIYFFIGDADEVNQKSKPITYYIDLKINSLSYFEKLTERHKSIIIAKEDDVYFTDFIVKNLESNLFFTCTLDKEDTSHILIRFDYPIIED